LIKNSKVTFQIVEHLKFEYEDVFILVLLLHFDCDVFIKLLVKCLVDQTFKLVNKTKGLLNVP